MRSRLLALGVTTGLAVLVALPGIAAATASPSPSASASASASPSGTPTASPTSSPTTSPAPSPSPSKTSVPTKKPKPKHHGPAAHHSGTTVTGQRMCKCSYDANGNLTNGSNFKYRSTVTVNQTTDLGYQMLQVSWTGFTPTDLEGALGFQSSGVAWTVNIVECRGWHPASPTDCWGADNAGANPVEGGPFNDAYAITDQNGTGTADIEVYTKVQNQTLNCDPTHLCSLVVIPAQGGNIESNGKLDCNDHSGDIGSEGSGNADADVDFFGPPNQTANPTWSCSWGKRVVIPLHFAAGLAGCPERNADFTADGSPMLADTMLQWQEGMCFGSNSVEVLYNAAVSEAEARNYFQAGTTDVAFTTVPLTGSSPHPFTYAPVAVSAVSVAFWVDNTDNDQPYTTIKLTPRLLTKMMTTSYAYTNDQCAPVQVSSPCDQGVDGNPPGLFEDPDFLQYNHGSWNIDNEWDTPTVVSGDSDMTWVTTSWIASNQAAQQFISGFPDRWGMHIDSYYVANHLKYPDTQFVPSDPYPPVSFEYQPLYPLSNVTLYESNNQPPGTSDVLDTLTGNPTYDPLPVEQIGQRCLFAIVGQGDAARFLFPVAYLQNAAGKFVQPTDQAMAAAVKDMTVNPDGITLSPNYTKKDPAAYPLTMVIYAVVPTGGIPKAKAAAIARFLDYVADQGQHPGTQPGNLAPGFLPLPESLRQQTLKAANEVLNQTGNPVKKTTTPSPSTSPSSSSPSPSKSSSPSSSPSPSPSPSESGTPTAHSIAVSFSSPDATGTSWVVLVLLIAGAVLLITGPAALVTASPGARAAIATSARRIRRLGSRTRNRWRGGMPRPTWRRNS